MPISSTMFFGAFILFSTLVVAAIAILKNAHDGNYPFRKRKRMFL